MSRRRNSIVLGVQDADRELLGEHNESFYGANDLSDSSNEEQAKPPAKRLDDSNEDEQYSNSDEQPAQPASEI